MVPIRKHEAKKDWVAPGGTPKPRVKPDLHPKKTMTCVSWDWEGMVHWETLERNAIVNKELYIVQLHRAKELFDEKNIDKDETYSFTTMPGPMLQKSSKPYSKSSNGRSFNIRRILRTLHRWITVFSVPCRTI